MEDPFATAPKDEAQSEANRYAEAPNPTDPPAEAPAPAKKAAPKAAPKAAAAPSGEGKVVLTFKGGSGFDAPWVVIHAADLQDAHDQVHGDNAALLAEIMDRSQKIGAHFAGLAPAKAGPAPQRQAAPAAAAGAPGGEVRHCAHGEMRFRSGISKAGKPYQAFFCASGDRNDECKAQFLR